MQKRIFWQTYKGNKKVFIPLDDMELDYLKNCYRLVLANFILKNRKVIGHLDFGRDMPWESFSKSVLWIDKDLEWLGRWISRFENEFKRRKVKIPNYKGDLNWALNVVKIRGIKKTISKDKWNNFKEKYLL